MYIACMSQLRSNSQFCKRTSRTFLQFFESEGNELVSEISRRKISLEMNEMHF